MNAENFAPIQQTVIAINNCFWIQRGLGCGSEFVFHHVFVVFYTPQNR